MKKFILISLFAVSSVVTAQAQQYTVITTVESIVPMGIGRSRIISHKQDVDVDKFTTQRTEGKDSNQKTVRRRDAKIDKLEETKLLNFYSAFGINFQNVASNDALISSKLTQMAQEGWELVFVTSGVESDSGETDGHGIFITRYVFKK